MYFHTLRMEKVFKHHQFIFHICFVDDELRFFFSLYLRFRYLYCSRSFYNYTIQDFPSFDFRLTCLVPSADIIWLDQYGQIKSEFPFWVPFVQFFQLSHAIHSAILSAKWQLCSRELNKRGGKIEKQFASGFEPFRQEQFWKTDGAVGEWMRGCLGVGS